LIQKLDGHGCIDINFRGSKHNDIFHLNMNKTGALKGGIL